MSLKKHFALPVLLFCGLLLASADVIQLKDQAAVTGKILAEKPDAVVVDVGYTVLVVPRSVIANISKSGVAAPAPTHRRIHNPVVSVNATPQFYYSDSRPAAARDVQDLVKQIGEAVVQVRTPGRPGFGIFHQCGRLSDHEFPCHRGRNGNFRGSVSSARRPARPRNLQAGENHRHQQIPRPCAAENRGQERAQVQIRHPRQFGCVERRGFGVCHRQSDGTGAHGDLGHSQHQDAPDRRRALPANDRADQSRQQRRPAVQPRPAKSLA